MKQKYFSVVLNFHILYYYYPKRKRKFYEKPKIFKAKEKKMKHPNNNSRR